MKFCGIINFYFFHQLVISSNGSGFAGIWDILGVSNGVHKSSNVNLDEPFPSKSQSYPYSDIPFASSQIQSLVVAAPTKVCSKIVFPQT